MGITVKEVWTNEDFDMMGWFEATIYNIQFPDLFREMTWDIDYIFNRLHKPEEREPDYLVAACRLMFFEVSHLKFRLDFKENILELEVQSMKRRAINPMEDGTPLWFYYIRANYGTISFVSTGFEMTIVQQPVFSHEQDLGRPLDDDDDF